MQKQDLIDFENDIAARYDRAEIPYPIHLSGGNESQLIEIFKNFRQGKDWVMNSWRSHLHALLAGVPKEKVLDAILKGRSMTLCWPEHRMFCSAIVGGVIPIAMGVAWEIKKRGGDEKMYLFVGDMTSQSGVAMECFNYSKFHDLPLVWICEDNNKSVCTDTRATWNGFHNQLWDYHYKWENPWPHSGAGKRIQF